MGHYLVNAVIYGLKGKTPEPLLIGRRKKSFNANSLAMLAVVANGQPNPDYAKDGNTFFFVGEMGMCNLIHLKRSCMHETRNYLVELGLLKFYESLDHLNIHDQDAQGMMYEYSNVYQLNVPAIRALNPDISDAVWGEKFLHITEEGPVKMNAAQLRALGIGVMKVGCCLDVRNAEVDVRNAELDVRNAEVDVRNADTNKEENKNKKQKNNTTMKVVAFGGVGEMDSLINRIADACQVNVSDIMRVYVEEAVRYRDPREVDKVIAAFSDEVYESRLCVTKAPKQRVAILVKRIKYLSELNQAALKPAVDAYQTRSVNAAPKIDLYEKTFNQLVPRFGFGELPKLDLDRLRCEFMHTFEDCRDDPETTRLRRLRRGYINIREKNGKQDAWEFCPDLGERVAIFRGLLIACKA